MRQRDDHIVAKIFVRTQRCSKRMKWLRVNSAKDHWSKWCQNRGAARIFLRGGGWSYGSKGLEKEKFLVIRIAKESTYCNLWIQLIDCSQHQNWGSFQLNCHLVSLILLPDDRKTRQTRLLVSAKLCFDLRFFFTFRKVYFSRPSVLHFCKVYETYQTSLCKTCLSVFPIFVTWLY